MLPCRADLLPAEPAAVVLAELAVLFLAVRGVGAVDYKDINVLVKLCTTQGKLFSRKRSGNCARHQRSVQRAIKRARFMALIPYVSA